MSIRLGLPTEYVRTSTLDQKAGLEAQQRDLEAQGCDRVFIEQVSSVDTKERHQLARALRCASSTWGSTQAYTIIGTRGPIFYEE